VALIKSLCEKNNINLLVLFPPMYNEYVQNFSPGELKEVYTHLAKITDFWDFSTNSLTSDCRFFYDSTHFRNAMGKMALAKIFGDDEVYKPDDIGVYVTSENAGKQAEAVAKANKINDSSYTKRVPILMYHDLAEKSSGQMVVSAGLFEEQVKALSDAGYTGVTIQQMIDYVEKGVELPEKPVLITFDDGYLSNYNLAYPILKKYNMKATIFVIGVSVGKDKYKDTGKSITPHFSYAQAREMMDSGLVDIQSHTYDMHQWADFEAGQARTNLTSLEGEKEDTYIASLKNDISRSRKEISEGTGSKVSALAYPLGKYNDLTEVLLSRMDIKATLTTKAGTNTIIKGLPQSLRAMNRFGITEDIFPEALIKMIGE
jgi:peptidoglycan/xylan/chitin deacetylase (PgdA/CDA1 family)